MTDPYLPQMGIALDPSAMAPVLERECLHLPGKYELCDCRISYVRYKPGRNCVICYELAIRDRKCHRVFRHLLCGNIYEHASRVSAKRWRKAAGQFLIPVAIGWPLTHIPELHMVVWAFPNDRRLSGLELLLDPHHLCTKVLSSLLPGEKITDASPELVRYVPENRCTIRVIVQTDRRRTVLYAKTYAEDQGEHIYQRLVALSGCRASGLVVPRPLAYSARTLWLEQIPGHSMEICFQPAPGARAVAALHQQDLAGLPRSDKPALLGQLADIRADAGAAGLETESLSKVCDELVRRFDELESLPDVTLHGDLTPRNLLVSGDAACLIDLDDLRRGNPLQDIGSFNAVLFHSAIVNSTSMAVAGQSAAAFSQAYAVEVPWRIPERNISLFTAHALVAERIGSSLKRGREDLMQPLLQVASRLLD